MVLRGVNHPHAWFPDRAGSFEDIAATGANAVRVVITSRTSEADVAGVVARCEDLGLVCVLENHDTTGFGDDEAAGSLPLSRAVDHWIGLLDGLAGHEASVIVNVGNEPFGNRCPEAWPAATTDAVVRLRSAGFGHALMVDGPDWGQDRSGVMREHAAGVLAADPLGNVMFSVHMYDHYATSATVTDYVDSFVVRGLPLVIGELGWTTPHGDVDVDAILAHADACGIGWLAWSWSGNSGGAEPLDMVLGFDPARPTAWGRRIIDGPHGLRAAA